MSLSAIRATSTVPTLHCIATAPESESNYHTEHQNEFEEPNSSYWNATYTFRRHGRQGRHVCQEWHHKHEHCKRPD